MRPSLETLQLIASRTQKPISFFIARDAREERQTQTVDLELAGAQSDTQRAIDLSHVLLRGPRSESTEALARLNIGRAHVLRGQGQLALTHLERAKDLFERLGDELRFVECLDQTACAYFLLGDARAETTAKEAIERCRKLERIPTSLESRIHANLARMHARSQRWFEAIRSYEECLKAGARVRNFNDRALAYDELNLLYQSVGSRDLAVNFANRAIALYALDSDLDALAAAETELAQMLMNIGHLEDAERHVRNALRLCDDHRLEHGARSNGLLTMGEIHLIGHQPDAANLLHEAINAAETEHQQVPMARAHQILGRKAAAQGLKNVASTEFETAIRLFESLSSTELLRDCLLEYASFVESAGGSPARLRMRAARMMEARSNSLPSRTPS